MTPGPARRPPWDPTPSGAVGRAGEPCPAPEHELLERRAPELDPAEPDVSDAAGIDPWRAEVRRAFPTLAVADPAQLGRIRRHDAPAADAPAADARPVDAAGTPAVAPVHPLHRAVPTARPVRPWPTRDPRVTPAADPAAPATGTRAPSTVTTDPLAPVTRMPWTAAPASVVSPPAARTATHGDGRVTTHYEPRDEVDLRTTLAPLFRGAADPTSRTDRATGDVWRTVRTEQGGATVVHRRTRTGVRVIAWGPGAERAIELAPELLGRGDDWGDLDLSRHPWLAETRRRHPGLRLLRTNGVFDALAPAIIEQKITGLEAHRAWRVLHLASAAPAPGPEGLVPAGMTLPLTPDEWRRIPSWQWHRAGVDHSRSTTILRAAPLAAALERTLDVPGARSGDASGTPRGLEADAAEEVTRRLRSLPGVGVWTAAETTQRSHGDPDAPSFGDYHLAAGVGFAFTGGAVDDLGMRDLLAPWRGQRQRIVRLIGLSGRGKPRRGPRMTVQDHRFH